MSSFLMRVFLASLIAFVSFIPAAQAGFMDVSEYYPYAKSIEYVQENALLQGYADGSFRPDQQLNRAEFASVIHKAFFESETSEGYCFPDVQDQWFSESICLLVEKKLMSGYPNGSFLPKKSISFAEAAQILVQIIAEEPVVTSLIWYEPYVRVLDERRAIPRTVKNFSHQLTRGELSELLYRLIEDDRALYSKSYDILAGRRSRKRRSEVPVASKGSVASESTAGDLHSDPELAHDDLVNIIDRLLDEESVNGEALDEFELLGNGFLEIDLPFQDGEVQQDQSFLQLEGEPMGSAEYIRDGLRGGSFRMEGGTDGLDFPKSAPYVLSEESSVAFWMRTVATGDQAIYEKGGGSGWEFGLYLVGEADLEFVRYQCDGEYYLDIRTSGVKVYSGSWHYVVTVMRPDRVELYVDGELRGASFLESGQPCFANDDSKSFQVGNSRRRGISNFFGDIDELKIIGRALDSKEIFEVYTRQSIKFQ